MLEKIKSKKIYLRKSEMTSGNAYRVTLSYKGKRIIFVFHDNYKNESGKEDFIYSLIIDSQAFSQSRNFEDFCDCFGYSCDSIKALNIYKQCEKMYQKYIKMFDDFERETLENIFQNY